MKFIKFLHECALKFLWGRRPRTQSASCLYMTQHNSRAEHRNTTSAHNNGARKMSLCADISKSHRGARKTRCAKTITNQK